MILTIIQKNAKISELFNKDMNAFLILTSIFKYLSLIIKPIIEKNTAIILDDEDDDEEKVQMKIKNSKVVKLFRIKISIIGFIRS